MMSFNSARAHSVLWAYHQLLTPPTNRSRDHSLKDGWRKCLVYLLQLLAVLSQSSHLPAGDWLHQRQRVCQPVSCSADFPFLNIVCLRLTSGTQPSRLPGYDLSSWGREVWEWHYHCFYMGRQELMHVAAMAIGLTVLRMVLNFVLLQVGELEIMQNRYHDALYTLLYWFFKMLALIKYGCLYPAL